MTNLIAAGSKMTSGLMLILLAGCGSGDTEPNSEASSTTPGPAPVVSIQAPDFVGSGELISLVADVQGSGLTYSWDLAQAPADSKTNISGNGANGTVLADAIGEYTIGVTVTDGTGKSGYATKNVTAFPPGEGPVITSVNIVSHANLSTSEANVPATFGQVFVQGDVPPGQTISGRLENGDTVPLQVDAKSWYPDGSLKHAVLSTIIPTLLGGDQLTLELMSCDEYDAPPTVQMGNLTPDQNATLALNLDGKTYSASLQQAMAGGELARWLEGPIVAEAHYKAPLVDSAGAAHPLLTARFHLRNYLSGAVRVDVIIENTTSLKSGITTLGYTSSIMTADGTVLMPAKEISHHHHSRWRKTYWFDSGHDISIRPHLEYLIATGTIPNYDLSVNLAAGALPALETSWNRGDDIMQSGVALEYMPTTGGRLDMGLLPGWIVMYLMTMDERAAAATYGTADAAAHWPIHFRDHSTDLPISLETYPYLTTHGNVFDRPSNPLPDCNGCNSNLTPDTAHQPSTVFVPYMLTGDYYWLEELHFWTNWNSFYMAPELRGLSQGLYYRQQVRGQAWSMRTLFQTVFITPDSHPQKSYFADRLQNNLNYYIVEYVDNPSANRLGWIRGDPQALRPWMDDFFTAAIAYGLHMGFNQAAPLLDWKLQYPLKRMNDTVFCWQIATNSFHVGATSTGVIYQTMAETYIPTLQKYFSSNWQTISQAQCGSAEMAAALELPTGDLVGYASDPMGYPITLRLPIAAALERGAPGAQTAWNRLVNAPTQPRLHDNPAFAILPR